MGSFLDIPTLLIATAAACFCICVGLALIWRSARSETFVLSWSICYGLAASTMLLMPLRGHLPAVLAAMIPGAGLLASFGALWLGYRQFTGRSGRHDRLWAAAGVLAWLVFVLAGGAYADVNLRLAVNSSIEVFYLVSIIYELVREYREHPLPTIGLTATLVALHAAKLIIWLAFSHPAPADPSTVVMPNTLLIGLSLIESSVFSVFLGLLQLVLIGQRSEQRFRIAAETDQLTGLANRRRFLDRILPRLVPAGGRGALIILDIDHFKQVNDSFGHPIGDRALIEFAATLSGAAPAGSIAARIGGEEFALFLPDGTAAEAVEVAERIRHRIGEMRIPTTVGDVCLTVSCGVAGVGESGSDYQTLLSAADSALYAAKSDGRDRVALHRARSPTQQGPAAASDAPAKAVASRSRLS
ncbi:MAG: GGDEF domain-containing protein [Ancalomicrobiaceae bacterium]|nr:GGDEF domain-containing protein [Ancalomicrobiaceae bacterium]